jgi:hypothetical protein
MPRFVARENDGDRRPSLSLWSSAQPRLERFADRLASCRAHEAASNLAVGDHEDRWGVGYPEPLAEVCSLADVHAGDLERLMVAAPLQHLREIALATARSALACPEEEEQARLGLRRRILGRSQHRTTRSFVAVVWPGKD